MWIVVLEEFVSDAMVFNCTHKVGLILYQVIYTDVALDPYNSDGHDGIVREDGELIVTFNASFAKSRLLSGPRDLIVM